MNSHILRKILGGLSFASALFMFQACYGTPQDMQADILIEGQVKSAVTGNPIMGIKVSEVNDASRFQNTSSDGKFSFYSRALENIIIHFEDIDSTENGSYLSKDTVLTNINDHIYLDIALEEK